MKKWGPWVVALAVGLGLALLIQQFLMVVVRVDGPSMQPNLQSNQRVVAIKPLAIKRFSVIVFDAEGVDDNAQNHQNYVKRVIGLPGDTIKYEKTGKLYVNGKYQAQNFISKAQQTTGTLAAFENGFNLVSAARQYDWSNQWSLAIGNNRINKVPKDCYFVLGDNRSVSEDSRMFGFVPKTKILGVVKAGFWSKNHQLVNGYSN